LNFNIQLSWINLGFIKIDFEDLNFFYLRIASPLILILTDTIDTEMIEAVDLIKTCFWSDLQIRDCPFC